MRGVTKLFYEAVGQQRILVHESKDMAMLDYKRKLSSPTCASTAPKDALWSKILVPTLSEASSLLYEATIPSGYEMIPGEYRCEAGQSTQIAAASE